LPVGNLKTYLMKYFFYTYIILVSNLLFAGTHAELCAKVKKADLVFEMKFSVKGKYSNYYKKRKWAPPQKILLKTARTGSVTKVFKGSIKKGSLWIDSYYFNFRQANSVINWVNFFKRKDFSQIYFLKKEGKIFRTTGEAEETASCKVNPQFSWCLKFSDYISELKKCLKTLPLTT